MAKPGITESTAQKPTNPFISVADSFSIGDENSAQNLDLEFRATLAKLTQGMSPVELANAYVDWLGHLSISPGKQLLLLQSFIQKTADFSKYCAESVANPSAKPPAALRERRMEGDAWKKWPFNLMSQSYLLGMEWLKEASENVSGVSDGHAELVSFINQQILEALSPANSPFTNPDVIAATKQENGANIQRGVQNLMEDHLARKPDAPKQFQVGKDVAVTRGKVIYQNNLIELIQYSPTTETVAAEPVLIVPPWIMKFYILDLSPHNSMTKYLVDQGKTVFMVSWKNPQEEDRDLTMDDYLNLGILEPIKAIQAIVPKRRINATGYCLGGTLLYIAAAMLARENNDCLNSVSTFTAQADFSEAGEIRQLISHSDLSFMESMMWKKGYLDAEAMGGAFQALRPSDLIWGPLVDRYLLGKDTANPGNDLMSWNADGTRMPYRMHTDYLRQLYLNNELAEGKYKVEGDSISLTDIKVPLFIVGTSADHVAPWKSVYKITRLTNGELTFLLTSGGHNAGIVTGAEHPRRSYQMQLRNPGDKYLDADAWVEAVDQQQGSWWPAWNAWLNSHSSEQVKPPAMGAPRKGYRALRDAPGEYVLAK